MIDKTLKISRKAIHMVCNHSTLQRITPTDRKLSLRVTKAMRALCDWNYDDIPGRCRLNYECHSICLALEKLIPRLKAVHGAFVGIKRFRKKEKVVRRKVVFIDHSWLEMPSGNIIDPHPVGIIAMNPLIVIGSGTFGDYGGGLYVPGKIQKKRYRNSKVRGRTKAVFDFLKRCATR